MFVKENTLEYIGSFKRSSKLVPSSFISSLENKQVGRKSTTTSFLLPLVSEKTVMTPYAIIVSLSRRSRRNISLFSSSFKYHYLLSIFPCLQKTVAKMESWTHYSKRKMTSYHQLTASFVWSSFLPVPEKNKKINK